MASNNKKSLWMLALSMVIFGSIGIVRRYIPLSSSLLAFFRGVLGALFLFILAKTQKKHIKHRIGVKQTLLLVLSGAAIGLNWMLLFEAYNHTTVATATLCYYMQPTIVILLSPFVFKEAITAKKWVCVILSVIGMIFVSGIMESGIPPLSESKGVLFGLGAAVLYAAVVIMNKKLPGLDAYEKTVIQLLSAALILVPYLLISRQSFQVEWNPTVIAMLLIVGVIHTGVAYALYFGSMDGVKAQTVAFFSYLDPVVALLLSTVILRERLGFFGIAGAILIIGAALIGESSSTAG
ncbi:MAG: EamA family transporter [Lachnospiraceae bacterium]|nr:EamA family transporter [Lachnospiraceae bacterium]